MPNGLDPTSAGLIAVSGKCSCSCRGSWLLPGQRMLALCWCRHGATCEIAEQLCSRDCWMPFFKASAFAEGDWDDSRRIC